MRLRRRDGGGEAALAGYTDVVAVDPGPVTTSYTAHELASGRQVVLLRLTSRAPAPWDLEAFRRQVRALTAVGEHPNVVTLYRVLRDAHDHPVLVLERGDGSLADRLGAQGRLATADVVALGVKIAGALGALHRYGFAHRDVRPATILFSAFGEPLLAGFGSAASLADAQAPGLVDVTGEHVAPELLEGARAVPATDVYSLASTLYAALAGAAAFQTAPDEPAASTILRILRDRVPPLVRPGVPAALSDVLLGALEKNPALRPAGTEQFAAALTAAAAGSQNG